jgi:hypothetical protein
MGVCASAVAEEEPFDSDRATRLSEEGERDLPTLLGVPTATLSLGDVTQGNTQPLLCRRAHGLVYITFMGPTGWVRTDEVVDAQMRLREWIRGIRSIREPRGSAVPGCRRLVVFLFCAKRKKE